MFITHETLMKNNSNSEIARKQKMSIFCCESAIYWL